MSSEGGSSIKKTSGLNVKISSSSAQKVIASATWKGHVYDISFELKEGQNAYQVFSSIKEEMEKLFQAFDINQQTESLLIEAFKQGPNKSPKVITQHKKKESDVEKIEINVAQQTDTQEGPTKVILDVYQKVDQVFENAKNNFNTLKQKEYATIRRTKGKALNFAKDFVNKEVISQAIDESNFAKAFRIIQNTLLASHAKIKDESIDVKTARILLEIVKFNPDNLTKAVNFLGDFFTSKYGIGKEVESLSSGFTLSIPEKGIKKLEKELKKIGVETQIISALQDSISNIDQIINDEQISNCQNVLSQLNQKLSTSDDQKKKVIFYFITQILAKKQGFDPSLTLGYDNIDLLLKEYAQKQLKVRFSQFDLLKKIERGGKTFQERLIEAQVALMVGVKPKSTGGGATGSQFLLSRSGDYLFVFKPSGEIHRDLPTRVVHATFQRYLPKNFDTFRYAWITEALPMLLAEELNTKAIVPPIKIGAVSFQDKVLHGTFAWAEEGVTDLGKRAGISRIKAPEKAKQLDEKLIENIHLVNDLQVTEAFFMSVLLGNVDLHRENFLIRKSEEDKYDLFMIDTALSMPTQNFSGHKRFVFAKGDKNLDNQAFNKLAEILSEKKANIIESLERFYKIHGYTDQEKLKQIMQAFSERIDYLLFIKERLKEDQTVTIDLVSQVLNPKNNEINWKNYKEKLFSN